MAVDSATNMDNPLKPYRSHRLDWQFIFWPSPGFRWSNHAIITLDAASGSDDFRRKKDRVHPQKGTIFAIDC
jgi:hypothetical protein